MARALIIAVIIVLAGSAAGAVWKRNGASKTKQRLHAVLATVRTYEEAYELRNGHYLLLPDSCLTGSDAPWQKLGMQKPAAEFCLRVEALEPVTAQAVTAPRIRIVGTAPKARLQGVETSDDSQPTWN